MKAVLDTNVLISGVIATGVPHEILVAGFNDEFQIIVSVETLTEFRATLPKYPDRFQMDADEIQEEVETIRYFAAFVDPDTDISAVEDDPDDDKFLEAAVAGNVDYIVSGDKHLLDLDTFRGIPIVKPRTFYETLESQQGPVHPRLGGNTQLGSRGGTAATSATSPTAIGPPSRSSPAGNAFSSCDPDALRRLSGHGGAEGLPTARGPAKRSSHGGPVKLCDECWTKLDSPRCSLCGTTNLPDDHRRRHSISEHRQDGRGGLVCDSCRNIRSIVSGGGSGERIDGDGDVRHAGQRNQAGNPAGAGKRPTRRLGPTC